jgi:type II secretory ATPase GspE/PulE/Tfp pilus assembly ATPase PilB-like protein
MAGACPSVAAMAGLSALLAADASSIALPFGIASLILLVGWVNLCLYLVRRVEDTPLAPDKYRSVLQVITLFAGPLVFLMLVAVDIIMSPEHRDSSVDFVRRLKRAVHGIWRSRAGVAETASALRLFDSMGTELRDIYGHGQGRSADRSILDLTLHIIDQALQQRASDILIDPKDQTSYVVRLRIDGTLRTLQDMSADHARAVINSIKAVSSMDISERRRPQDGAFTARQGDNSISFRVASAGAMNGEKLSIRALNQNAGRFTLADTGLPERQRALIAEALNKPSGMILVCGPTGSGKTTTLYSMLNQIDRMTHNVITVEDPIEAHLPEASQIEINTKADITFAKALRSILRQDPDVICVGEIRDEETAQIALRAAQTGHLVLATIHCDSNATAMIRLLDLGVSPILMSSGLNLLVSQRLMRTLCDACKKPAHLDAATLHTLQQRCADTKHIFEAGGCLRCGGTGYYGRTALCDVLTITDQLRTAIANDPALANKLKAEGEKRSRTSLYNEGLRRVVAGQSSLEELKRVTG